MSGGNIHESNILQYIYFKILIGSKSLPMPPKNRETTVNSKSPI
jgi:hypothetical protein